VPGERDAASGRAAVLSRRAGEHLRERHVVRQHLRKGAPASGALQRKQVSANALKKPLFFFFVFTVAANPLLS